MYMIHNEQHDNSNNNNDNNAIPSFECIIIILQTIDMESNHIRINMVFDPNSTALQFKSKIYEFLLTSKYKNDLQHEPYYYSEIGITNQSISPHDIFEIFDDDILMDCIDHNQTVYLYHPSINTDSVLLNDYNEFYKSNTTKNVETSINDDDEDDDDDDDDDDDNDNKTESISMSISKSRKMSMSYESQQSFAEDIDIECIEREHKENNDENNTCFLQRENVFFNSLNLHFAYIANKYGVGQNWEENPIRSQLVQICHSVLIWGLRKMDNLWKLKHVQDKLQQYLKMHAFDDKEIIDIVMFGNKLNDENALHLIKYSPWQISENKLSVDCYQIMGNQQNNESLTTEAAAKPIQNEQQKAINKNNNNNIVIDNDYEPTNGSNEPLNAALYQIKQNKHQIERGPRRWPAHEGMFLYFCQFVFGTCISDKFEKYMKILGKSMELNDKQINYILLLWESERNLASSLWEFAEFDFPLLK